MTETTVRLLRLLSLLQARPLWSGAELADRLEVTTRTIRNDIERLRILGYQVRSTTGTAGGCRLGYQVRSTTDTAGGCRLGAGAALPPLLLDHDGTQSRRSAEPHRLVFTGRRWYLLAWDVDRDDWRTFRADRIAPAARTARASPTPAARRRARLHPGDRVRLPLRPGGLPEQPRGRLHRHRAASAPRPAAHPRRPLPGRSPGTGSLTVGRRACASAGRPSRRGRCRRCAWTTGSVHGGGDAARWFGMVCWHRRDVGGNRSHSGRGWHGRAADPLARQLALSALTTEQFNLQTARMGTIAEANGRSALYLGTLSSAVIAIAFVGQANQLGDSFYLFALTLLPPVFLLGVFSYLRLVQTSIEDLVYAVGSFRIRQYFLRLDPAAVPFFPQTDPQGIAKLERIGVVSTGPLQMLLTAASMVACINAIVGGVTVALAVRSLLDAAVSVAAVTGAVVALLFATLFFVYQVRRFRRAAAVVPELFEGESPGMPGWSGRMGRREG